MTTKEYSHTESTENTEWQVTTLLRSYIAEYNFHADVADSTEGCIARNARSCRLCRRRERSVGCAEENFSSPEACSLLLISVRRHIQAIAMYESA